MVEARPDDAAVKKQIEYYLSDTNLSRDKFFREQIETDKQGWVDIAHFLNCNKIKNMKTSSAQIADACADSSEVDVNPDKTKIRRKGNKTLPERNTERRRDLKAAGKAGGESAAAAQQQQEDQFDADGKIILVEKDFDNP